MDELERILPIARRALLARDEGAALALESALADGAPDRLLSDFARLFLDPRVINCYALVQENNLILHLDDELIVAYKIYKEPSQFLYSTSSRYLEYIVSVPSGARVDQYKIVGFDPRMSQLATPLEGLSLTSCRNTPLAAAQLVSHSASDQVLDMQAMAGGCTIKFQLSRVEPYEIVFSRETLRAVGGYQTSFRASTLSTLFELVAALEFEEFEEPIAKLVDDPDPLVAWEAIRALDVYSSNQLEDALTKLTHSPVEMLKARATAALEARRSIDAVHCA